MAIISQISLLVNYRIPRADGPTPPPIPCRPLRHAIEPHWSAHPPFPPGGTEGGARQTTAAPPVGHASPHRTAHHGAPERRRADRIAGAAGRIARRPRAARAAIRPAARRQGRRPCAPPSPTLSVAAVLTHAVRSTALDARGVGESNVARCAITRPLRCGCSASALRHCDALSLREIFRAHRVTHTSVAYPTFPRSTFHLPACNPSRRSLPLAHGACAFRIVASRRLPPASHLTI